MEKYRAAGQARDKIWCMRIACWITKAKNSHSEYVILIGFHCNIGCTNESRCFVNAFFVLGATAPSGPGLSHDQGFIITFRHITLSKTPLDECSAQCRDLYLTTYVYNTHKRQRSMPSAGFQPKASTHRPTP